MISELQLERVELQQQIQRLEAELSVWRAGQTLLPPNQPPIQLAHYPTMPGPYAQPITPGAPGSYPLPVLDMNY